MSKVALVSLTRPSAVHLKLFLTSRRCWKRSSKLNLSVFDELYILPR
jgi:hypothetical protein